MSDTQESKARIRDAVASHRPPERIESTTDPTVVPELIAVWSPEFVIVDADMQPLDGFELRATLEERDRQLSVVVVSTEPADDESTVTVVDSSEGLAACLGRAGTTDKTDTPVRADQPLPTSRLESLIGADSQCELINELTAQLKAEPPVRNHRLWLTEADGSLEAVSETNEDQPTAPAVVEAAVETGEPQRATDPPADPSSTNQADTAGTVAYPLGEAGAVEIEIDTHQPAVAGRLTQLTTVAGACLDHQSTVDELEARFRQTAERNRELSQFARTVAHDLNSPLSVIYGRIELALTEQSDADMHLQAARNAAQRVDSLITDHLQSIEAVDAESEREEVSIQTVAIQAWRIIDPSTARLQIEPQLETVEANAIRLQQLFENLIRNAIEHGSEEMVGLGSSESRDPHAVFDEDIDSVTVTIKPTDSGFAVCDDGPGVPPDEREEIFESGYTTTESGSGLGLHIVDEIVDSHGWEISVTESASGGARFEIDTQ